MSLINQVLRELDARGGAPQGDRINPWSPDAGRGQQEVRFFPYPGAAAPRPLGRARNGATAADGVWQRGVLVVLASLLLMMLLATVWLPERVGRVMTASMSPTAPPLPAVSKPATPALPVPTTTPAPTVAARPVTETTASVPVAPAVRTSPATTTVAQATPTRTSAALLPSLDSMAAPAAGRPAAAEPRPAAPARVAKLAPPAETPTPPTAAPTPPADAMAAPTLATPLPLPAGSVEKTLTPLSAAQRAQASYAQAVEWTRTGRSVQALTHARDALRHQPGHVPSRQLAAVLLHETAHTDQAVALLNEGLALEPQSEPLGLLLARLQLHQGQRETALATLDRHQLHSLEAEALRAGLASQLHLYKQAIGAYEAALQQQPGQAQWWLGLGVAFEGDGQGRAAREAFSRAQAMGLPSPELSAYVAQRLRALE